MQSTSPTGSTARIRRLPFKKRVVKLIGRVTFWVMVRGASLLRPWSVWLLGNALGMAFYRASGRHRNITLRNLRAAFGKEKTEQEIESVAKEVFRHFTREAFQFFHFLSLRPEDIDALVAVEGREHLDAILAKGKGCIALTAHYGNWELMARKMAFCGYKVNVIARDSDDPGMTGIATRIRESGGYRVFDRDQPIIGAFRALKKNEVLGILPDQHDYNGIFVDFFGRQAATADGVAVLSLKSGAQILPMFNRRMPDGRYRLVIYPPIEFEPSGDQRKDIHDLTSLVMLAIEREIRQNPSQWLWMHDKWKRSPEAADVN